MQSVFCNKPYPVFRLIATTFLIVSCSTFLFAQKPKVENLPKFDQQRIHFGFMLGLNYTNFVVHRSIDPKYDSIYVIEPMRQPGFNLGIVSDLRLGDYFNLRFIPDLAFASRALEYTFVTPTDTFTIAKEVESTFVDFPLLLKYKSARVNNYRAYVIAGVKYSLDVASQKDVNSALIKDIIIKVKDTDLSYEVGFGFDCYLRFFKLSPEFKYSVGVRNILINEDNAFAGSIDKLNSKMFTISLLFE